MLIKSIRMRKLTKGRDLDRVDNKTLVNSLSAVQCLPGFQTVKTKYASEQKPFFQSKNFELKSQYMKPEYNPNAQVTSPAPTPITSPDPKKVLTPAPVQTQQ